MRFLHRQGIAKSAITYTRAEQYDVVILREHEKTTYFMFSDEASHAEVTITCKVDSNGIEEKINTINQTHALMSASLKDGQLYLRMWTEFDNESLYATYLNGLEIIDSMK